MIRCNFKYEIQCLTFKCDNMFQTVGEIALLILKTSELVKGTKKLVRL